MSHKWGRIFLQNITIFRVSMKCYYTRLMSFFFTLADRIKSGCSGVEKPFEQIEWNMAIKYIFILAVSEMLVALFARDSFFQSTDWVREMD